MMQDLVGQITHGMSRTREYRTWKAMHTRCRNPLVLAFKNYGGRGITVCKRWHLFENFYADMGPRPKEKSIDRVDNNGNYELKNCRWATRKEQRANSRDCSCGPFRQRWFFAYNEITGEWHESNNQGKFAKIHGLDRSHISACLLRKQKTHKYWKFWFLP